MKGVPITEVTLALVCLHRSSTWRSVEKQRPYDAIAELCSTRGSRNYEAGACTQRQQRFGGGFPGSPARSNPRFWGQTYLICAKRWQGGLGQGHQHMPQPRLMALGRQPLAHCHCFTALFPKFQTRQVFAYENLGFGLCSLGQATCSSPVASGSPQGGVRTADNHRRRERYPSLDPHPPAWTPISQWE